MTDESCGPIHHAACKCREAFFKDLEFALKTTIMVIHEQMAVTNSLLETLEVRLRAFDKQSRRRKKVDA